MKLLLKHCDILAGDGEGYRYLADAYLSIDGSVIDYIGTEPPKAAYDREKFPQKERRNSYGKAEQHTAAIFSDECHYI